MVVHLTYGDAISEKEVDKLIATNEEAIRLTSETVTRVYLVNIFPIRTSILMLVNPLIHLSMYQSSIFLLGSQVLGSSD